MWGRFLEEYEIDEERQKKVPSLETRRNSTKCDDNLKELHFVGS